MGPPTFVVNAFPRRLATRLAVHDNIRDFRTRVYATHDVSGDTREAQDLDTAEGEEAVSGETARSHPHEKYERPYLASC